MAPGKFNQVKTNGMPGGYVVTYDVPQPDGSHAVTVARQPSGTVITVR